MNTDTWLRKATNLLTSAGINTARLDCLVLLEYVTGKDRAWLLAHPEVKLSPSYIKKLDALIKRRVKHEPLAYIRGKSEFYGREFIVSAHTLEPRPESETMVDLLKQLVDSSQGTVDSKLQIVDVGTGSGCLAITAKLELPEAQVYATDIDKECIKIARQNASKLGADVKFYQGNLLKPISSLLTPHSSLLCNLPYVPDSHTINQAAMFEPKHAIFGGEDGLDYYRALFQQIATIHRSAEKSHSDKPLFILTESLPFQHKTLAKIAQSVGYKLKNSQDFIQVFELG